MNRPTTSASNLFRRALCPGSEKLEAGLPDEESEQAKIGTLLHQYDANPALDRSFLSQRNRELLEISEACDKKIFARVIEQFGFLDNEPFIESMAGEQWWLVRDEKGVTPDTPGHTDRWRYWKRLRILCIIDKKFGFKEVAPATSNIQLRLYACAGAQTDAFRDFESCVVAITQPRLPYEQRITMAHYDKDDIALAREEIFAIRDASREPDAPLVPGPEQCRYCKASLICPALRAEMSNAYALVPVEQGTVTKRKADAREILERCSDNDLDKMIQFVRMAKFVEEMALDEGRKRAAAGQLPMYELGDGTNPRHITNPAKAEAILALKGILDRETIWSCSSMAIGKLEESIAEKKKLTMKEARKLIDETLASVIEREQRKPSLIRKS